jgi:hypothetical protein
MLVHVALTLLARVLTRSQAAAAGLGFGAMLVLAAWAVFRRQEL